MTITSDRNFVFDTTDNVEADLADAHYKLVPNPEFVEAQDDSGPCDACVFLQKCEGKGATKACELAQQFNQCVTDQGLNHYEKV